MTVRVNEDVILKTAAATEPVTLAECKEFARVDETAEDSLIENTFIPAASRLVERTAQRQLINASWYLYADDFADEFIIPKPPLSSVTAITYIDSDGNSQTLATTEYQVDTSRQPGRIKLAFGKSWPTTRSDDYNAVTIEFVAGYGTTASSVPETFKLAIMMIVSLWIMQREAGSEVDLKKAPFSVRDVIGADRHWSF